MPLQNSTQNKWNSESNVSKNKTKCAPKFSEFSVKKLVQKYEDLNVSAINSKLRSGFRLFSSEQFISKRNSEMFGDAAVNLNENTVHRFLSLDNDENVFREYRQSYPNSYTVNQTQNCDGKMQSISKNASKSTFKSYTSELDKERKHTRGSSPSRVKKKEDILKIFSFNNADKDKKKDGTIYNQTLPSGRKKQETSFGKNLIQSFAATTSRDKKSKTISPSDNRIRTIPKDGSSIVKTRIKTLMEKPNTGAIKKQLNSEDDIIYRKRRDSYIMATQNDEDFRRMKIYPDVPKQSHVSKTISKFENRTDFMTAARKSKHKVENEIRHLFQQYHDSNKFGTSSRITREELSLEIDNILLNKFKQISNDNSPETSTMTSAVENHSSPQDTEETITLVVEAEQTIETSSKAEDPDIPTEYVICVREATDGEGEGQSVNLESAESETLSARLSKVLNNSDFNGSVENLCDALNRSFTEFGVEIKDISVVDDENMIQNIETCTNFSEAEVLYENIRYMKEKIAERSYQQQHSAELHSAENTESTEVVLRDTDDNEKKRKVSNLVSYFSDIIAEKTIETKRTTLDRNMSFSSTRSQTTELKQNYDDDVFISPPKETHNSVNNNQESFCSSESFESSIHEQPENMDELDGTVSQIIHCNTSLVKSMELNSRPKSVMVTDLTKLNRSGSHLSDRYSSSNISSVISIEDPQNASSTGISCTEDDYLEDNKKIVQRNGLSTFSRNYNISSRIIPQRHSVHGGTPFSTISLGDNFSQYSNGRTKAVRTMSAREKGELLKNELKSLVVNKKQQSSINNLENGTETTEEIKPRLSRLYSGKFTRPQDKNNNVEKSDEKLKNNSSMISVNTMDSNDEQHIYTIIKNDTTFLSDTEEDCGYTEACNDNDPNLLNIQKNLSTSEWVEKAVSVSQFDEDEDSENIYERIKSSGSLGTLCTIYDEQNNPAIRFSMMDITGEYVIEEEQMQAKIEESERELRKHIEEIQDNSKRACLINELITTEKNYINHSLHRLVHDYMPEMDKETVPKGLVGKSRQIFGNADMIYEGHKTKFLPELESYLTVEDIAMSFLNHETIFKLYPLYSKNKPKSDTVMKDYGAYFKRRQDALEDKLDLASYLLTPVQRLAKYCLLVKSLVKECEKENIPCDKLKVALEMLNKQMRMGNDLIALDSIVGYDGSIREQGEVLLRDSFLVQPPGKKPAYQGMIFLFQESLIITAINRQDYKETFQYKESFQLTDLGLSDLDTLEFSVWYRKHNINTHRFRTKHEDLKQKWVKEIFNLLWKQLEANKKRKKKELEESGVRDTRIPVIRPFSVPHKVSRNPSPGPSKSSRKRSNMNSSADTVWYTGNK